MKIEHCTAPSPTKLRPFKPDRTATFPVYPDLVDTLASAETHPDRTIAHALGVCSAYAYGNALTVATTMARMGLENNNCLMVEEYVDALFLTSTSFVLQSADGRVVIVSYRGTPPMSIMTWLTDATIEPIRFEPVSADGPFKGRVHSGFYRNVRSTRHEILAALERAAAGRSVHPDGRAVENRMQALYLTGHSLGGASAAMLALMLVAEPAYKKNLSSVLKAAYTFGAPMIASPALAEACDLDDTLHNRVIRYVYADDIVPQMPPSESFPFKHFGTGRRYIPKPAKDASGDKIDKGEWEESDAPDKQLSNPLNIFGALLSIPAGDFEATRRLHFHASLRDHLPQNYVNALTPPGIHSEFGA
jgi:Lipase (class 3)